MASDKNQQEREEKMEGQEDQQALPADHDPQEQQKDDDEVVVEEQHTKEGTAPQWIFLFVRGFVRDPIYCVTLLVAYIVGVIGGIFVILVMVLCNRMIRMLFLVWWLLLERVPLLVFMIMDFPSYFLRRSVVLL